MNNTIVKTANGFYVIPEKVSVSIKKMLGDRIEGLSSDDFVLKKDGKLVDSTFDEVSPGNYINTKGL